MTIGAATIDLDDVDGLLAADRDGLLRAAAMAGAQVRATAAAVDEGALDSVRAGGPPRTLIWIADAGPARSAGAMLVGAFAATTGVPIVPAAAVPPWTGALDVVVVAGADAGDPVLVTAAATGARVISVEPNPVVLSRLQYNLAANDLSAKVTPVQKGVSDAKGTFDLVLDDTNLGGSSLVAARSDRSLQIECDLLQDILQDNGIDKIDAMKIDIEGAEDRALFPFFENAPENLFPSILIMENSAGQWQRDLPALLKQKGYRIMQTTRMNVIWEKI